jgi:hypothetical protein
MTGPATLHEDDNLLIRHVHRPVVGNGRVLLSFTGIGHGMGGMEVQRPEFFRAGESYEHILFVSDLERTWGNSLDFGILAGILDRLAPATRADAIGNSMGGFLAVLAGAHLPMRTVLAFAPQFSVHPDIVPGDPRWMNYRSRIADWSVPSLEGRLVPSCRYYLFSGGNPLDAAQLALFPSGGNIVTERLAGFDHGVGDQLKQLGLLGEVVTRCFDGTYTSDWLRDALDSASTDAG